MKSFRLIVHQKNFSGRLFLNKTTVSDRFFPAEDLIINPKDYPGAKVGDVLEIYHQLPEDDNPRKRMRESEEEPPRLLLQIKIFPDETTQQNALQKGL